MEEGWGMEGRMEGRTGIICQFAKQANRGSGRLRGKQKMVQMVSGRVGIRPQIS